MLNCPICDNVLIFPSGTSEGECRSCGFGYLLKPSKKEPLDCSLDIVEYEIELKTGEEATLFMAEGLPPIIVGKDDLDSGKVTREEAYQNLALMSLGEEIESEYTTMEQLVEG